jgi:type I restriction-modification system DNA methylase subunit
MAEPVQATQQDIESWLWESANILRGPVDPANLRDFVFPLLFLKRLSDTWDEEQEKAVKKFGKNLDDETAADFLLALFACFGCSNFQAHLLTRGGNQT